VNNNDERREKCGKKEKKKREMEFEKREIWRSCMNGSAGNAA
jgi:hypothetical protein